jgi:anti-anti-sigma factor
MEAVMEIELERQGEALRIVIDGNIDMEAGGKLAAALQDAMEMPGIRSVVFDLSTVRTITSSGIGKIMNFFKHIDGRKASMSVKGISDPLYKQFMEIHLDRIFPVSR